MFYPSDAVSCERAVELAANTRGICFIRASRPALSVCYANDTSFEVGKAKILRESAKDKVLVVAAGVTLPEALKAADDLAAEVPVFHLSDAPRTAELYFRNYINFFFSWRKLHWVSADLLPDIRSISRMTGYSVHFLNIQSISWIFGSQLPAVYSAIRSLLLTLLDYILQLIAIEYYGIVIYLYTYIVY